MMAPQPPSPGSVRLDPFSQEAIDKSPNKYGKQAYTASHRADFQKSVGAKNLDEAVAYINNHCGVKALRFIDDTPEAIAKWQELKAQYDAWFEQHDTKS
jgi:hypothetical protein